MGKKFIIFTFVLLSNLFFLNLQSKINNNIIAKVGELLITSIDLQNEILTNLVINNVEITQENVNSNKKFAVKNLINKSLKRNEINKYKITDYNKVDLQNYIESVAKNLNTSRDGLEEIFKQANIDYKIFVQKHETELLWNSLIFQIYKNQININIVDVDNEFEKLKEDKNDDQLKELRKKILNKKKQDKLNLFSRSHFSNIQKSNKYQYCRCR